MMHGESLGGTVRPLRHTPDPQTAILRQRVFQCHHQTSRIAPNRQPMARDWIWTIRRPTLMLPCLDEPGCEPSHAFKLAGLSVR